MSSVKKFVKTQLEIKEMIEDDEKRNIRFSVTLSPDVNRRLEYVAKKLEFSRSGMANQLIVQALSDVEDVLGLEFEDESGQFTEYANYVHSDDKEAK